MTLLDKQPLDELCINTMRMLSIDAIQQANSGHPGLPLGAATMAYVLWTQIFTAQSFKCALAESRQVSSFRGARFRAPLRVPAFERA